MTHAARHPRIARTRPAWVAIAVVLGMLGGIAPGAVAAPSASASKGRAGGHRCPCGMDCGPVCCCKHKAADEPAPQEPPTKAPRTAGPCLASAPCGGALPPGVSPVAATLEKADRPAAVAFVLVLPSGLLVPPTSDRPRAFLGSPPDEPPERAIDA